MCSLSEQRSDRIYLRLSDRMLSLDYRTESDSCCTFEKHFRTRVKILLYLLRSSAFQFLNYISIIYQSDWEVHGALVMVNYVFCILYIPRVFSNGILKTIIISLSSR